MVKQYKALAILLSLAVCITSCFSAMAVSKSTPSPTPSSLSAKSRVHQVAVGTEINLGKKGEKATWKSSNTSLATVNSMGKVTGSGVGKATVFKTVGKWTTKYEIVVRASKTSPNYKDRLKLSEAIRNNATAGKEAFTFTITIPASKKKSSKVEDKIIQFFPATDELFAVYMRSIRLSYFYMIEKNGDCTVEATCFYKYSPSGYVARIYRGDNIKLSKQSEDLKKEVENVINKLHLRDMKYKYEKVLAVHDYIVLNCAYDDRVKNVDSNDFIESYSAYGVLIDKKAVCQGYAEAMKLILNRVGVECDYVVGKTNVNHAWNRVRLDDGMWYNIDATWDDPLPDRKGRLLHTYFCITDEELEKTHTWTDYTHRCTSTKYDYPTIKKLTKTTGP